MPVTTVGTMTGAQRRTAALIAALLSLALAACTPEPAPTPTPTGFASEEEAFAAAEATLRAYVEATNSIKIEDPVTFEPLLALTTGDQKSFDKKRLAQYHADDYSVSGTTLVTAVQRGEWLPADGTTTLLACLDVSDVDVMDASGASIVDDDRPAQQSLTFSFDDLAGRLLVSSIAGSDGTNACSG